MVRIDAFSPVVGLRQEIRLLRTAMEERSRSRRARKGDAASSHAPPAEEGATIAAVRQRVRSHRARCEDAASSHAPPAEGGATLVLRSREEAEAASAVKASPPRRRSVRARCLQTAAAAAAPAADSAEAPAAAAAAPAEALAAGAAASADAEAASPRVSSKGGSKGRSRHLPGSAWTLRHQQRAADHRRRMEALQDSVKLAGQ